MKYLITGGAGYIGSHVAHQLADGGHDLVVLDNLYSGHRWAVPESATFIEGSCGDRKLLQEIFGQYRFDAVLHFAAHTEVAESVNNPAKYYFNNTFSALTLFEECQKASVRNLIFSSTAAVYGESGDKPVSEQSHLDPVNPYGRSKLMAEQMLRDLASSSSHGMRYVILRYFNVAGAREDGRLGQATPRASHLVKVAAETALGIRPSIQIFGTNYSTPDGTCLRDYIHVEDLAQAHLDALRFLHGGGESNIFNVGYGRPFSVREVLQTMQRIADCEIKIVEAPRREGDASAVVAEPTKIKTILGWTPKYASLEKICETAFRWEQKYRKAKLTLSGLDKP